jgi:RNA recognition motif-containing protein
MKIYVGNLSYEVTEVDLRQEFGAFGEVASANIITDKFSGRPKGFGFVEMASKSEAEAAITGLNGKTLKDRTIVVNESRPRTDSRDSGSYGNRRGGGSGGGGYGNGRGGRSGGGRQRRY